ncbi:MAG: hypothetical protein NZ570_04790 [Candidatus Caldarchaeum sp.]|nr:hypothetical protein [Candidatus Caldarchaeum sp.]MDW8360352.1 hypothetical protein [Candidatus Caldarchaeum sp.]
MSKTTVLDYRSVSRMFLRLSLVNAAAACVFTAPVLVPSLAFPILLTQWGAVYMVLGYFSFLTFGVLGALGWAAAYSMLGQERPSYDKALTYLQLATHIASSYGASAALFAGGYIGARLVYEGRPVQAVGMAMEIVEIPAGFLIALAIASTLMGLVNTLKK